MVNGEAVQIKNCVEIAEYTNNLGLEDKDSIVYNKVQNEDDLGTTLLIISISTGRFVQNIIQLISCIIIFVVIIIIERRYRKTKKIYR